MARACMPPAVKIETCLGLFVDTFVPKRIKLAQEEAAANEERMDNIERGQSNTSAHPALQTHEAAMQSGPSLSPPRANKVRHLLGRISLGGLASFCGRRAEPPDADRLNAVPVAVAWDFGLTVLAFRK